MEKKNELTAVQKKRLVTNILRELGVPADGKGFEMLRQAILLVLEGKKYFRTVTSGLYAEVGEMFGTTAGRAERNMRNRLEVTFEHGNMDAIDKIFGFSYSDWKGRPTLSNFIFTVADEIKLRMEEQA